MEQDKPVIVLDWGTSSLRAVLLDGQGRSIDSRASDKGVQFIGDGAYEQILLEMVGDWLAAHGPLTILASGMIGSRNGWLETPYVDCPADTAALATGALSRNLSNGSRIHFLPGLRDASARPFPDVMRGEEAQIVGLGLERDRVVALPGTHSKWARVEGGRIAGFQTFITGEFYALLSRHSFLARLAAPASRERAEAFDRGAAEAASDEPGAGAILSALFGIRTGVLAGKLAQADVLDYASGLVIGHELRQARDCGWFRAGDDIDLVGNAALTARYARAAAFFGLTAQIGPDDAAVRGILTIGQGLSERPR